MAENTLGEILARMAYLEGKMNECRAAINYQALSGHELKMVISDRMDYEREYKELKLKLSGNDSSEDNHK